MDLDFSYSSGFSENALFLFRGFLAPQMNFAIHLQYNIQIMILFQSQFPSCQLTLIICIMRKFMASQQCIPLTFAVEMIQLGDRDPHCKQTVGKACQ
jgi:hypothetical protein